MSSEEKLTYDKLLYGKAGISRVVGLECDGENLDVYRLLENYEIEHTKLPFKYWLLSSEAHGSGWTRMKGDLHYKYGKQFSTKAEFSKARYLYKDTSYSVWMPAESAQVKDGISYFLGLKPLDLPVLSFDLETTGLNPDLPDAKILLISNTFRKNGETHRRLFAYDDFESQGEMLLAWSKFVREMNPAVITGHNIFGFDFPYMLTIADKETVSLDIGRDGSPAVKENYEATFRVDGSRDLSYHRIHVHGRQCIDTMFLAYRYDIATKKYESYGLKSIIKTEGLEKAGRVFYDAGQIRFNYTNPEEWAKIKTYCNEDSDDALALFDLMCPPYFYMTQSIPRSFQQVHESATGAQINGMMVRAYLQDKHSIPKATPSEAFSGAISMGNPGIYRNVHKVDVASLYPSIMIQYEVCDTKKDPEEYFKKLVSTFTSLRLQNKALAKKDKYYDDLQSSQKIAINSMFGFLGTQGLQFNSPPLAAFITAKGREILQDCIVWATGNELAHVPEEEGSAKLIWVVGEKKEDPKYPLQLVNADTDSISYCRADGEFISKEDRLKFLEEINARCPERISWEDDGFYKTVCVLRAKNYVLQTEDGKVKTKGSAIKATLKCPALKEFINRTIESILADRDDFKELYDSYVQEIVNMQDISRWCGKKSITSAVLDPKRTNEQKVYDIIQGGEFSEGDKLYVYFREDDSLALRDDWKNDHSTKRLLKNLYDTSEMFDSVLKTDEIYMNYALKRNLKGLELFKCQTV